MEEMPKSGDVLKDDGRRGFLQKIATLAGGLALSSSGLDTFASNHGSSKESNIEIFIEDQIEKSKDIIKNKKYEEILENPYLVSSLYYSDELIDKIKKSQTTNPQRIIAGITSYITPEFRQNYIKTLNNISKTNDIKSVISDRERAPLSQVNIPKDLSKNHQDAIDLFIDEKSPISPMASGLVVLAENGWKKENDLSTSSAKGGNTVIIFNPINKSFYRYEHMQDVFIKTGDVVGTSVTIGTVGHTGLNASIPGHGGHLHLEVNAYHPDANHMRPTDVYDLEKRLVTGNDLFAQK